MKSRIQMDLLRHEVELLMAERAALLKAVGAAASLVDTVDGARLPHESVIAAELLAASLNQLPEETLDDALAQVRRYRHPELVAA